MFGWTGKKAIVHDVREILAQEAGSDAQQGGCDVVLVSLKMKSCRICDDEFGFEEPPLALSLRFNLLIQGIAISAG